MATRANTGMVLSIESVNGRIDKCVKDSNPYEIALWIILITMIVIGIVVLLYGVIHRNIAVAGLSLGDTGLMVWPFRSLTRLHRRRIALIVIPEITMLLSPGDAAQEIHSLIEDLLDKT